MSRKVIVTCAINGDTPRPDGYPPELEFPITPQQICSAVKQAAGAGASIVHVHARDPATGGPSRDPEIYREIVDRIRSSGVDIVINLTCGHGATFYVSDEREVSPAEGSDVIPAIERLETIERCLPEMCSLDISTANQVDHGRDYVYFNPAPTLRKMAGRLQQIGVKPELEIFQGGDVLFGTSLIEAGLVDSPPLFQFVLGTKWCAPATTETLLYLKAQLPPGAIWTALGIGRMQMPIAMQSVIAGGQVRVGLEDNLYRSRGAFATNGELVERAVEIVDLAGEAVATPAEAREMLNLRSPQ